MREIDHILVENGDLFDGTREQFRDCFFSNADNNQIIDWCIVNKYTLAINGIILVACACPTNTKVKINPDCTCDKVDNQCCNLLCRNFYPQ